MYGRRRKKEEAAANVGTFKGVEFLAQEFDEWIERTPGSKCSLNKEAVLRQHFLKTASFKLPNPHRSGG